MFSLAKFKEKYGKGPGQIGPNIGGGNYNKFYVTLIRLDIFNIFLDTTMYTRSSK